MLSVREKIKIGSCAGTSATCSVSFSFRAYSPNTVRSRFLLTIGVRVASWQYGHDWSLWYLWGCLDWISRLDILVLALTFAYIVIVAGRGSCRCSQARCESHAHLRALRDDLRRRVRTLQSIASVAPYLGLAGTCFGVLDSFKGVGMQKAAAMAMWTTYIAASLLTTASGLLVALAAASSSNYLSWRTDKLELKADPQWCLPKYPLRGQFSKLPAFALLAAPTLAAVLVAFSGFFSFHGPMGLHVRLLQMGALKRNNDSPVQPLFVGLSDTSPDGKPDIYLNSKKTSWETLGSSVCDNLQNQPQPTVYVESEGEVRWDYVAMVIDSVRTHCGDVVLLTSAPAVSSGDARRSGRSKK